MERYEFKYLDPHPGTDLSLTLRTVPDTGAANSSEEPVHAAMTDDDAEILLESAFDRNGKQNCFILRKTTGATADRRWNLSSISLASFLHHRIDYNTELGFSVNSRYPAVQQHTLALFVQLLRSAGGQVLLDTDEKLGIPLALSPKTERGYLDAEKDMDNY